MQAIGTSRHSPVYEAQRQYGLLEQGHSVAQESRGFDEGRGVTYTMRTKEDAPDYRYLHEPNVPALILGEEHVEKVRASLPELPDARHARLRTAYGLSARDVNVLVRVNAEDEGKAPPTFTKHAGVTYRPNAVDFFEDLVNQGIAPQQAVNWTIHILLKILHAAGTPFCHSPIPPAVVAELITMVDEATITPRTAQMLLREMAMSQSIPLASSMHDEVAKRGLAQLRTEAELLPLCQDVIEKHAHDADAVRNGKKKAMMTLVGAVMRLSGGRADAQATTHLLHVLLGTST